MASETLDNINKVLSNKFNRALKEWGSDIPDIPINDFLHQNKKIYGLKEEVNGYWKDKNLRNYCFDVVQEKNNGNNGNNGHKEIDPKRKNELYEALVKYTAQKEAEFREKENKNEVSRDRLKSERDEILRFVRARETLRDNNRSKNLVQATKEQKIRDAKIVTKLTGKAG